MTGLHVVADIHCNICDSVLGWKYVCILPASVFMRRVNTYLREIVSWLVDACMKFDYVIVDHPIITSRWKLLMSRKSTRRTNSWSYVWMIFIIQVFKGLTSCIDRYACVLLVHFWVMRQCSDGFVLWALFTLFRKKQKSSRTKDGLDFE